jgi:hypothetical protein
MSLDEGLSLVMARADMSCVPVAQRFDQRFRAHAARRIVAMASPD